MFLPKGLFLVITCEAFRFRRLAAAFSKLLGSLSFRAANPRFVGVHHRSSSLADLFEIDPSPGCRGVTEE